MEQQGNFPYDLIDRYVLGELVGEELQQFEASLKDEGVAKTVAFRRDMLLALKAKGRDVLKQELVELEAQQHAPTRATIFQLWHYAAAVAAAVVILLAVFLFPSQQELPEAFFAANFRPYPNVLVPIERDATAPDMTSRAFAYYEQGAYEQAIPLLEQLVQESANPDYAFYLAISKLEVGIHADVVPSLTTIASVDTHRFAAHAEWYLALTYFRLRQQAAGDSLIKAIAEEPDHPFQKQAKELMK